MASQKTAAAAGKVGELRFDPMAMLPFCGYHMADYWRHWLDMGKKGGDKMPRIFYVNWFRRAEDGHWLWPGFGDNSRVLKWVCERCTGKDHAVKTPLGYLPTRDGIDLSGLNLREGDLDELLRIDINEWKQQVTQFREHYAKFGSKLPRELCAQLDALEHRLSQES